MICADGAGMEKFKIGSAEFRKWGEGESTEVLQNGVWTHVPDAAAEAIGLLHEALKPFAEESKNWGALHEDDFRPNWECIQGEAVADFNIGDLRRAGALVVEGLAICNHNWVDARNEAVVSGEICLKCNSVRSGNQERAPQ